MNLFFYSIFIFIFLITLNFIINKSEFHLDSNKSSFHKKITGQKKIPLSGGLVIISIIIFFLDLNDLVKIFLFLIFIIGFFSDKNKLISPNLRFLLQIIVVFLFIIYEGPHIEETRIIIIDNFLNSYLFKIVFTSLCILIILNGSNFIDGVNANLIGETALTIRNIPGVLGFLKSTSSGEPIPMRDTCFFACSPAKSLNN